MFIRKRLRLFGYDYNRPGYYFVTICTKFREPFLGDIVARKVVLSDIGQIAIQCWLEIPKHFPGIYLDEFVIMPDHMHGIVVICDDENIGKTMGVIDPIGAANLPPLSGHGASSHYQRQFFYNRQNIDYSKSLLPKVMHGFKSSVTRQINCLDTNLHFQWQRSYYDHIIRNEQALNIIRGYIKNNPQNWHKNYNSSL